MLVGRGGQINPGLELKMYQMPMSQLYGVGMDILWLGREKLDEFFVYMHILKKRRVSDQDFHNSVAGWRKSMLGELEMGGQEGTGGKLLDDAQSIEPL